MDKKSVNSQGRRGGLSSLFPMEARSTRFLGDARLLGHPRRGQTLVMLLVFIAVATAITVSAVTLLISSGKGITSVKEGGDVFKAAESAAENAYLRLLRNPNYAGETLTIDGATTTSTVTGSSPKTITAVATRGGYRRSVVVTAGYSGGIFSIQSWVEAP